MIAVLNRLVVTVAVINCPESTNVKGSKIAPHLIEVIMRAYEVSYSSLSPLTVNCTIYSKQLKI